MSIIGLSFSEIIAIVSIIIAAIIALYIFYKQIVYQNDLNDLKNIHNECSLIVNQVNEIVKSEGVDSSIFQPNKIVESLWTQVGLLHENSIQRASLLLKECSFLNLKKSFISSYVLDRHLLEQRIINILGIENFIALDEKYNNKKIINAIHAKNISSQMRANNI